MLGGSTRVKSFRGTPLSTSRPRTGRSRTATIRIEPRRFRVVPKTFHRFDVPVGKAVVASLIVAQGRPAPVRVIARHTVRTLAGLHVAKHPRAGFLGGSRGNSRFLACRGAG